MGAVLLFSGCATIRPLEDRAPAPSSSFDRTKVKSDAALWALTSPGRSWSEIAPTGSMAPLLDSRSVALYESYHGQPLYVGDWVVFDRGDFPNVLHRIEDIKGDYLFIGGVNNHYSDGWFHKSRVKLRVAGVLYSTR
jgi:hypothetical protein